MTTFLSYLIIAFLLLPFVWYGWCAWQFVTVIFNAIAWRVLNIIIGVWKLLLVFRKPEKKEEGKPSLHVGDDLGWR